MEGTAEYYVVKKRAVPEVLLKVVEVNRLLETQKVSSVQDAVDKVGISRSSYYKYKDGVFKLSDGAIIQKATIGVTVGHKRGTLSNVLDIIAECGGNILTINQDIPNT